MEKIFAKNAYPEKFMIKEIAEKIGVTERKVYNWFRRERMSVRRGKCQKTKSIGEFVWIHSAQVSIKVVVNFFIS